MKLRRPDSVPVNRDPVRPHMRVRARGSNPPLPPEHPRLSRSRPDAREANKACHPASRQPSPTELFPGAIAPDSDLATRSTPHDPYRPRFSTRKLFFVPEQFLNSRAIWPSPLHFARVRLASRPASQPAEREKNAFAPNSSLPLALA